MNNLKALSTTLLFILLVGLCEAQTKIVVQLGATQSKTDMPLLDQSEINADYSYRQLGAMAGIDLRIIESQFFVQFGLHYLTYSSNSLSLEEHDLFDAFADHSKTHQIKSKIMAGFNLVPKNKIINLYVIGGVQPYYLIKQSSGTDDAFYTLNELERINVGASYGVGIDLFNRINIEGRQEISLEDYAKTGSSNLKTNVLTIGYIF